jgi:excisionase family DNA binding protein
MGIMELLTVKETADMLRVSAVTVRRFIADGRLPAVKIGRAVRVDKAEAERVAKPIQAKSREAQRKESVPEGRPFTHQDSLWDIVGIAGYEPDAPTDVADNVDKYLAEAYLDTHE